KALLHRPAMALDRDQRLNRDAGRTAGRETGRLAIADAAPDQQAADPQAATWRIKLGGIEIGQFEIRPVIQPRPLGAVPGRKAPPGRWLQPAGNVFGRATDDGFATP